MEATQKNTSNAYNLKRNIKITVTGSELGKVKEISQLMTHEAQFAFKKTYGFILDLLFVPIEPPVLSALSQFWNPSLRCFELPNLDITPTIEEYTTMIRLPIREKAGVYLYQGRYIGEEKIARLIGVQTNQMAMEERGLTRGVKRSFLEAHLQALAQQGKWDFFNQTLALIIYGLVLFPFTPDIVDQAAMDVFYKFATQSMNPIPAILADTFLTLEVCHQKNGGRLRCCSQMLYVWFMTHAYAGNRMGSLPHPLKDFYRVPTKHQEAHVWKQEFSEIESNAFMWVCPWYQGMNIIYNCGDFPNVPLMGPRGCVSYTPALVLRQLHWTQTRPQEEQLGGCSFLYQKDQGTRQLEEKIKMAWQNIKTVGEKELGKQRLTSSLEYREWRKARIRQDSVPKKIFR